MFARVPAKDGIPVISLPVLEGISIIGTEAGCYTTILPEPGIEITDLDYLARYFNAGVVSADKTIIMANGLDTATVTAEVHPDLTEITFYHADTGEPIATVPVDPEIRTATLQVTATTPGTIHIRAGEPTITRLNEVVITAQ